MDLDLKALKIDKENSLVEAKSAQFSLPKSIWDSYSAFANTSGGQILLGVSEDSKTREFIITGVDDVETVKKEFWDTINNPKKVSNNILSENDLNEIILEDGKTILLIHVPKARLELRPIYINDDIIKGSFKRNHEGDYHLTKDEISKMLRDASPYSYDLKVYDNLPLSVLSNETITSYRRYHEAYKPNHPWLKLSIEQYLVMIGAAAYSDSDESIHPTMAGLLMFSEEHEIVKHFPDYFLDYRENLDPGKVRWTDRIQSISGEWSGNIFDFYLMVNNKLVKDFKVPFKLNGMQRVDNTSLHDAAREAFINCLSNADYFGRCGIVIRKNTDSIVFENPGSIRVGKEQMLQGGISDTRNKTIMKMFNLLGYGEKAGSGIPLIMQASKEFGLPKPQVDENSELDRTLFALFVNSNNRSNEESTGDNARNVIDNAENAVDNAENVVDNAENAVDNAGNAVDNAENAVDNAENAVDNAENAVDNAENAVRGKCYSKNKIYDCLKLKGPCSSKYLAECIGLSVRRTQELLLEMIKEDKILAIGVHPEKKYMIKKDI